MLAENDCTDPVKIVYTKGVSSAESAIIQEGKSDQ